MDAGSIERLVEAMSKSNAQEPSIATEVADERESEVAAITFESQGREHDPVFRWTDDLLRGHPTRRGPEDQRDSFSRSCWRMAAAFAFAGLNLSWIATALHAPELLAYASRLMPPPPQRDLGSHSRYHRSEPVYLGIGTR
jgi:hypothetical protein